MAERRLSMEKRVKCIRLYSVSKNASKVRCLMTELYGPPGPKVHTVIRLNRLFDETGSVCYRKKAGRPRSVRTQQNQERVAEELAHSPHKSKSQRRLSTTLGIKRTRIQKIMHDTKLYPYRQDY
ncbi:hypothetical protein C0J52_09597 [Blattella germanica]|nr:hypothetical protein C0J52_09597 [Blattella germanica]